VNLPSGSPFESDLTKYLVACSLCEQEEHSSWCVTLGVPSTLLNHHAITFAQDPRCMTDLPNSISIHQVTPAGCKSTLADSFSDETAGSLSSTPEFCIVVWFEVTRTWAVKQHTMIERVAERSSMCAFFQMQAAQEASLGASGVAQESLEQHRLSRRL
jgi:hypothetical protein